jgi:TRAP-type C4-dicarboxylate transport system permease small subunit
MPNQGRYSLEGTVSAILFIILFVVLLIQVFGRTPLFDGPVWTEEGARWLWVWMVFVGIGEVERTGSHLKMDFLVVLVPKRARQVIYSVIDIVYFAVIAHLAWIGWKTVLRTLDNESVTLPTVDAVLYASAFVAMILILYRVARRLLAAFGGKEQVR